MDDPWTKEEGKVQLERRLQRSGLTDPAGALALAIERQGSLIGTLSLWRTDPEPRIVEVGWTLDPAHGGQGYASEAVTAGLQITFKYPDVHRVVTQMDARNTASARLAIRVGMRQETHHRQDYWSKGEWTDSLIFAMLADEGCSQ